METNPHVTRIEQQAERDLERLDKARKYTSALEVPIRRKPIVCDVGDLLALDLPPRETLLSPWLQSQSLAMLYAWRGVGKTHVALGIAYALASGGEFLGWHSARPVPVLYLDGEMPGAAIKERIARIVASTDKEAEPGTFRILTPDLQPDGIMPDLGSAEGRQAVNNILGESSVIVVDNLSCMVRSGKENEADGWQPVADWALQMRATRRSVVFVHHAGKGGQQRGTSKREDILDTVIALKRPADYQPDEGARFEVHYEKARALYGQDVTPFEATLKTVADGRQQWSMRSCEAAAATQMIELADLGLNQSEIARELGVHRSTVLRSLKRAQDEGRYIPKRKGAQP